MNMSDSATHSIRFTGAVYGASKCSYSDRCVNISIHMASTVVALKELAGSFTKMFTCIAGLTVLDESLAKFLSLILTLQIYKKG